MNEIVEMETSATGGIIPGTEAVLKIMPAHVTSFLQKQAPMLFAGFERIDALETEEDFLYAADQLQGVEQAIRIMRGYLYRAYQAKHSAGRCFLEFLAKHGISKSTAYDYIYEAEVFERLGDEADCATVATLSAKRVRELRHLNPAELNAFVHGETIKGITFEEARTLDPKELYAALARTDELKALEVENRTLKAKNEVLEEEALKERLKRSSPESAFIGEWATTIRTNVALDSQLVDDRLDAFTSNISKLEASFKPEGITGHEQWRLAAGHTLHQLGGIAARAQMLYRQLAGFLPDDMQAYSPEFSLQEEEVVAFLDRYELVKPDKDTKKKPGKKKG